MRILTFNVQDCRAGLEQVTDVVREVAPDVATVNEIRRDSARALGRATGMHATFGAALRWRRFGNAVLSRERPASTRSVRFRRASARQRRGLVMATFEGGVSVVATHLGLSANERVVHARQLLAHLPSDRRVIVGGDFNEAADAPAVALVRTRLIDAFAAAGTGEGLTFPADRPQHRIDYVFVSPNIRVAGANVVAKMASDHLPVVVEVL